MSYNEIYSEKAISELLNKFGKMTVKEVMSSATSNAAIPTLVSAKTFWYLNTFPGAKAEEYAHIEDSPLGEGLIHKFQVFTAPTYQTWGTGGTQQDGTVATPVDVTLAAPYTTMMAYGQAFRLSDLLQGSTLFNCVEALGFAGYQAVRKAINTLLWTALKTATNNTVSLGTSGNSAIATPTFANIQTAKGYAKHDVFLPDFLVSGSAAWDAVLSANWTNEQFSGALIQYVESGSVPRLLGMDVIEDPIYGDGSGANAEYYMSMGVKQVSLALAQRGDITTEYQRQALALAQDIVVSKVMGAGLLIDKSTADIVHA